MIRVVRTIMKSISPAFFLVAIVLLLAFSGCVVPGYPPNYAYGNPSVLIPPIIIPGRGYGYWYGGNFWGYRNGYSFYNGHYYAHNGWHGGGYGGNRGYGGDGGWSPRGGYGGGYHGD